MSIRCKFECTKIEDSEGVPDKVITLEARYDEKLREDQRFAKLTPFGTLRVQINNPVALAQLRLGAKYYLDLVPIEEPPAEPANPATAAAVAPSGGPVPEPAARRRPAKPPA